MKASDHVRSAEVAFLLEEIECGAFFHKKHFSLVKIILIFSI